MARRAPVDPAELALIRDCAAQGLTLIATANRLGVSPSTVWQRGRKIGVTFGTGRKGVRRALIATDIKSTVPKSGDFASPDLRAQIEAAKIEAATARPFRGAGW